MAIKSKNAARFFPRAARITAFILACVFSGTMLFSEATERNKSYSLRKADAYDEIETSYASSEEYRDQMKDMYEELCILGICALANCDEEMN